MKTEDQILSLFLEMEERKAASYAHSDDCALCEAMWRLDEELCPQHDTLCREAGLAIWAYWYATQKQPTREWEYER